MASSALITTLKLSCALAAIAAAQPLHAQTAEQQAAPAPEEVDPQADGGTIVVTARRVEESLQRVPSSVSAFSERSLERIQATDTTGLQGAVPNLNIVQGRGSSNATNIFIRGIGQPDALQTFDPAVGFYVDDVYYSRIRGTQIDLLDLERVEILRGPQGTLYGKNTIGGAFKVVTRKPGQDFRARAEVAIGSYDQLDLKGSVSGPLNDSVAAGLAVLRAKRDGFVEDRVLDRDYNDKDTLATRGALAFTPGDRFRFDVSADYQRDNNALNVGQPLNSLTYLLGGVLLPLPANPDPDDYDYTARTSATLPNSTKLRHWGVAATATYDVSDVLTLKSITAYRDLKTRDFIDIDATEVESGGDVQVNVDQHQISEEVQLAYTGDRLQAVGGLYYLKEKVGSHQEAYADQLLGPLFGNATFLRTIDDDLETESMAAYGNATYSLTDALRLTAGIRFTREEKDYFRTTTASSSLTAPPFGPLFNNTFVFEPQDSWKDVSPTVSLDYQVTPETMIYGRYARGFKSGGFNGRANSATEATSYKPEEVDSFEAGAKTTIANQLRLSVAAFYNDYRNFQARVSDTDESQGVSLPQLSVFNAGKLEIKGAELEASWTPIPRLLLDTQIGYLDAEYKEFDDVRFPGGSRAFQTPAFAPDWTLRTGAQYEFDLANGGLIVGGQARYRSETALAVDNTFVVGGVGTTNRIEGLFQEAYWLADARIVWEDEDRRFSVGLYGQNLTDKAYKTDGQDFSSIGSIRTVYYGAPRTFTLRLGARY